jgi:two-component system OmpR family response regulator
MIPPLHRILCIDDEEDILQVAKLSLEMVGGFEASLCKGSRHAAEQVRLVRPDLLLLDVMMPEMDGPTTLAKLRGDASTAAVPVIFMTAKAQPSELQHYLDLGAIGVISKPFDPMTLSEQIQALWKKHHERDS